MSDDDNTIDPTPFRPTPVIKLTRDLAQASKTLSDDEARFLVDAYYQMQGSRIRHNNQVRSMLKQGEPHGILLWLAEQSGSLEEQIKRSLDKYSAAHPVGEWMRAQVGIGPVIAAGLLAHIDITKAPTVGHIWRFAGLDPTSIWSKGERRPWNADLKTLCWHAGESFVKFSNHPGCFYGHLYKQRKEREVERNERGDFKEQAADKLAKFKINPTTDAFKHYTAGHLPPARIHARARRYAVKIFLAHVHGEWYRRVLNKEPPLPYPIAHLGHAHIIEPPTAA